ncbi:hypothetical protein PL78_09320 [Yersinia entomophaga]|uniref:Uncharacterized protein n=1 Tax=Yersinia entomophaga TaxID=935293 RepID=A0ABM6BKW3_YERET|nr:hypothetical protein [Yersinia entomophaga]ANI30018.1 hypothetical protein PL78_09320 [Yersinia entomophaga]OWF87099.1 hypothetical protein B4914_12820 [Yersinia entomophaga]
MKSICLPVANAILRTYTAEIAELNLCASDKGEAFSFNPHLRAREKEVITCNAIAGLTMITTIAWQLCGSELNAFHQLSAALQEFKTSGIAPQPFNDEVETCPAN